MVDGACARREYVAVRLGRRPPRTPSHSEDAMRHSQFRRPLVWGAAAVITASVAGVAPAQRATSYTSDDGQELTNLAFTPDGNTVVYVRGGDHDANWEAPGKLAPDPAS